MHDWGSAGSKSTPRTGSLAEPPVFFGPSVAVPVCGSLNPFELQIKSKKLTPI